MAKKAMKLKRRELPSFPPALIPVVRSAEDLIPI